MMDNIALAMGVRPWDAAPDAELQEVLNRYDMPLAGILRQSGQLFLFSCIEGQVGDTNLWAYVPVFKDEVDTLRLPDVGPQFMWKLIGERPTTLALARHGHVVRSTVVEPARDREDLLGAAVSRLELGETDLLELRILTSNW